ncbi:programmed cell death protein 5-like protein [Dinothrombium tinctorium]|uniref:Programmed cell death protein 5-like protein n=1 Tax=Dinothrombium tinctorium TaxID=1965070 RepID=A0A443R061_9ACAR|nr:programmed cell death protein 5-like protein [Dinothrombium tinctorium]
MDDDELQAIRAKRLQQLQSERSAAGFDQQSNAEQQKQQQKEKEEELRNVILSQILTQEARARLNTLKAAKPGKAKSVEDMLIANARMGIINGKLSEADLINVLERINQQTTKETKVKFDRRRANLDDSDED